MSDDEAAFLRTIRAAPDADLPRLVYADWLEERGFQLRAEFLRAQIELAGLTEDSPRRRELAFWCRTQLEAGSNALGDEPLRLGFPRFRRGLIEAIEFWEESAEAVVAAFESAPIRRAWVYGLDGWRDAVSQIAADNCLETLDLTGNEIDVLDLEHTWEGTPFPRLKELVLTACTLNDHDAKDLRTFPRWSKLQRIHLGGNPLSEDARQRLRDHFGDRVTFECARDPEYLYPIAGDDTDAYTVGFGRDLTQHFLMVWVSSSRLAVFDHAGNLLRMEERPHPPTTEREPIRAALLEELGHEPATIRVKRFAFPEDMGIQDYSRSWMRVLEDREAPDQVLARRWLFRWLEAGKFRWRWEDGSDRWLDRDGEVTDA